MLESIFLCNLKAFFCCVLDFRIEAMKSKAFLISEKHIICSFSLELYRVFYFFPSGLKSYDDRLWYEFVSIHCTGPSQSRNNLITKICSSVSLLMISFVHISFCLSSMLIFWASELDSNFLVISLTFFMHLLFFTLHLGYFCTFNFQNFFYNFRGWLFLLCYFWIHINTSLHKVDDLFIICINDSLHQDLFFLSA